MNHTSTKPFRQTFLPSSWLKDDLPALQAYVLALSIALLFIAYMFPFSLLDGSSKLFDPHVSDNALHMSSWWYFAKDTWHFPVLLTNRTDYPIGQNIAFTDSIPLAAIFFKLIITAFPKILPDHFHYFGWWIILVFIMQAISATMLMRALNLKNAFSIFIAVSFAISWPPLHVRYPHTALMMQSIIIFSMALYFLGLYKKNSSNTISFLFILLNLIALLVHPYFLPFTFGIYCAYLIDETITNSSLGWKIQICKLFLLLLLFTSFGYLFGYFAQNAVGGGYGTEFSFDLLSPICGNTKWSRCAYLGSELNARSFEGYNYLGFGLIILVLFLLILNLKKIKKIFVIFNKNPGLTLIIVGLLIYSITNHVRYGDVTLFTFEIPHFLLWLTGTFRAAGRFFWLIGYLILFLTLAYFIKKNTFSAKFLLVTALLIQLTDNTTQLKIVRKLLSIPSTINYQEWNYLLSQVEKVNIYPLWGCQNEDFRHVDAEYIYQVVAYHGKIINSGYTARNNVNCGRGEYLKNQEFEARNLYMIGYRKNFFSTTDKNILPSSFQKSLNRGECVVHKYSLMCLPGSSPEFWRNVELNTNPAIFAANSLFLSGPELNTQLGKPSKTGFGANLISSNPATPNWLSFAPSIPLPLGKYKYNFTYSSAEKTDKTVGNWDVVLQQGGAGNEKTLFSGKLVGTLGSNKQIEGIFTILPGQEVMPLEIRSYFLAQGDLEIVGMSLVKLP